MRITKENYPDPQKKNCLKLKKMEEADDKQKETHIHGRKEINKHNFCSKKIFAQKARSKTTMIYGFIFF